MVRNLGGSIGLAMLSTIIDRRERMKLSVLAQVVMRNAALTHSRLAAMAQVMRAHMINPVATQAQALGLIASQASLEACAMAYGDAFWIIALGLIDSLAVPLRNKPQRAAPLVDAPDPIEVEGQ